MAEERSEQRDAEGEAERDGVELEGAARAPVRSVMGDGVSHERSFAGRQAAAPRLRIPSLELITDSAVLRASLAMALAA